jgi:GTP cyclohydrolase I
MSHAFFITVGPPRRGRAVRRIQSNVGENPARDGLLNMPKRVRRMYGELPGVVT